MKHNTMKRVLAATLSVLTVAAPMTANVGGILQEVAIVASARDEAIVTTANDQALDATKFEKGDYFESDVELNVPSGTQINIRYGNGNPCENVTKVVYETKKDAVGETPAVEKTTLKIYCAGAAEPTTIEETAGKMFQVTAVDHAGAVTRYTINQVAVAEKWKLTIGGFDKFIKSLTYTNVYGTEVTKDTNGVIGVTAVDVKQKTMVTIVSSILLNDKDDYLDESSTAGNYIYKFKMLKDEVLAVKEQTVTAEKVQDFGEEPFKYTISDANKENASDDIIAVGEANYKVYAGSTVTITADHSFKVTQGEGNNATTTTGAYTSDGLYAATFTVLPVEVKVTFTKHEHNIKYTLSGNKLTTTCDSDENDLDNVQAAFVAAYIPDDEDKLTTPIANNTAYYLDDVNIKFTLDSSLLGVSGYVDGNEAISKILYRATLTQGTTVYTLTKYAEGKDTTLTKTVDGKAVEGTAGAFAEELGLTWHNAQDGVPANFDNEDDGFTITKGFAGTAGTTNVKVEVWGTDTTAAAKELTYTYEVKPSEKITANDVVVLAFPTADAADAKTAIMEGVEGNPSLIKTYTDAVAEYNNNPNDAVKKTAAQNALNAILNYDGRLEVSKNDDGVYEVVDPDGAGSRSVTLLFLLKDSTEEFGQFYTLKDNPAMDGDFSLSGTSYTDKTDVCNMDYTVVNPNYKRDTFRVQWQVVNAPTRSALFWNDKDPNGDALHAGTNGLQVTDATLVARVVAELNWENIDVSGFTVEDNFVWFKEKPQGDVDIDDINYGLPTDVHVDDVYYIQASDGTYSTGYLKIRVVENLEKIDIHPVLNKTEFTYGELVTVDDISFVDGQGNPVAITPTGMGAAATIEFAPVDDDGNVNAQADAVRYNTLNLADNQDLKPGKYLVKFVAGAATLNAIDDAAYAVTGYQTDTVITVAKKQIDWTLFKDITLQLQNDYAKVTAAAVNAAVDTGIHEIVADTTQEQLENPLNNDNFGMPLTVKVNGHDTANSVGSYEIVVEPADAAVSEYYEGEATLTWHAYKSADAATELSYKLLHDKSQDNIYTLNGGVQLHVEVNKYVDDGVTLVAANTAVGAKQTSDTVSNYGLLYDKTGYFAKDADAADVNREMRLGGQFDNRDVTKANSGGVTTGLNFALTDPTQYVWVRPYSVVEGGAVVYGDAFMVDFESVAQDVVRPTMDKPELVQRGGKLMFFSYGEKKYRETDAGEKTAAAKKTAEPVDWGFVIDRTGNYGDDFDYENLTLDNCDATSLHANKSFTEDETAVLAVVQDSLSKVYMRAYVDFGNGMVVYYNLPAKTAVEAQGFSHLGDDAWAGLPDEQKEAWARKAALADVSCESASATLADAMDLKSQVYTKNVAVGENDPSDDKWIMTVSRKTPGNDLAAAAAIAAKASKITKKGVELKFQPISFAVTDEDKSNAVTEVGAIIDKNGVFNAQTMDLTLDDPVFANAHFRTPDPSKNNNPMFDNPSANSVFNGKTVFSAITKKGEAKVSFRGYAVYKGVTVYTPVVSSDNRDGERVENAVNALI